jgi:hypothetical protein
VGIYCPI